jgi:mannose-6-phosphate isomerase-like protein (cupin superfamily)
MRLAPGEDIGREVHPDRDQFLRIESGTGRVEFGTSEDAVEETHNVAEDWAIVVPAGVWHNVVNTGDCAMQLYLRRPNAGCCSTSAGSTRTIVTPRLPNC